MILTSAQILILMLSINLVFNLSSCKKISRVSTKVQVRTPSVLLWIGGIKVESEEGIWQVVSGSFFCPLLLVFSEEKSAAGVIMVCLQWNLRYNYKNVEALKGKESPNSLLYILGAVSLVSSSQHSVHLTTPEAWSKNTFKSSQIKVNRRALQLMGCFPHNAYGCQLYMFPSKQHCAHCGPGRCRSKRLRQTKIHQRSIH